MEKRYGDWRPGPDTERSFAFDVAFCNDPKCGLHIVPLRKDGTEICEIVMSAAQTLALVEICKSKLYDKATRRS